MDQRDHNSFEERPDFLKDLSKNNSGYKVPVDYFSHMQSSVLHKVIEPETAKQTRWIENIQFLLQHKFKVATIMTVAVFAFIITNPKHALTDNDQTIFSNLDQDDLDYFVDNSLENWDNQDLLAVMSEEEINIADLSLPIATEEQVAEIPEQYIEDLDDSLLIEFNIED